MSSITRLQFLSGLAAPVLLSQTSQPVKPSLHFSVEKPIGLPYLRSIAVARDSLFLLWMPRAIATSGSITSLNHDGKSLWSRQISGGIPLHLILDSDSLPICTTVERGSRQVRFTKFGSDGTPISQRSLPSIDGILGSFATDGKVGYLNTQNSLIHGLGVTGAEVSTLNSVLEMPGIKGNIPPAGASSVHRLASRFAVLDHHQAAYAQIEIEDSTVSTGQIHHERFRGTSFIAFAASNQENELFLVPSPMNSKRLTVMNLDSSMTVRKTIQLELPSLPGGPETRLPIHYSASGKQLFVAYLSGDVLVFNV